MLPRISSHRQYELGRQAAQQQLARGAQLQQDITSGVRIHRPSDDPSGQKIILTQQSLVQRLKTQLGTLSQVRTDLNHVQSQTQNAQQLVVRAKTIAIEARQTTDNNGLEALASELDSILNQLDRIANTSVDGRYLFSGTQTDVEPYSGIISGQTTYSGGDQSGQVSVGGLAPFSVNYSGREVFQPVSSGNLTVTGNTGIQPGAGTSSGSAPTTVIVRHTLTSYAGGSGVQAGASSVNGDTIIGARQLTIIDTSGSGAFGTISLNGGAEAAFTNADGDLQVTGPNGEVVYVNTQSIAANFNGTVDLTADGTISIDGGVTETSIDFSANQTLVNDALGVVQHFDTQNVTRAGTDAVEFTKTGDIFAVIRTLRDDLRGGRGLSRPDWNDALDRRLADLDAANDHLLGVIGEQSVSLQDLDQLETRLNEVNLAAEARLTETQGTDYTSAIVELQEQQNMLQYTLASLTSVSNTSILDFLK